MSRVAGHERRLLGPPVWIVWCKCGWPDPKRHTQRVTPGDVTLDFDTRAEAAERYSIHLKHERDLRNIRRAYGRIREIA